MTRPDSVSARRVLRTIGVKLAAANAAGAVTTTPLLANAPSEGRWFKLGLSDNTIITVHVNDGVQLEFSGDEWVSVIRATMNPPQLTRTERSGANTPSIEQQLEMLEAARVIDLP